MPAGPPSGRHLRPASLRARARTISVPAGLQHLSRPVKVGKRSIAVAITPDGKTAYVANIGDFGPGTVTPVATSTNTAGKPIEVGAGPTALVIAR